VRFYYEKARFLLQKEQKSAFRKCTEGCNLQMKNGCTCFALLHRIRRLGATAVVRLCRDKNKRQGTRMGNPLTITFVIYIAAMVLIGFAPIAPPTTFPTTSSAAAASAAW
jgi:hypothetical protein